MRRRRGTVEDHERLVWGESEAESVHKSPTAVATANFRRKTLQKNDDEDDDMDIHHLESSPRGQKRRHSPHSSTAVEMGRHPTSSQLIDSPSALTSQRRRPRGSDAGKSIHKAAEAPQTSPGSFANQHPAHRLSTGSVRLVTPTNHHRTGRIAVAASLNTARKSSTVSPHQPEAGLREKRASASGIESSKRRLVTAAHGGTPPSERPASTPMRYQPQVARKSASKVSKALKTTPGSARPQFATKAAQKSVSRDTSLALSSHVVASAPPAEDSSDDGSVSSSSESSVVSAPSTGLRVRGRLHADHVASADARVVSLSPRGTPRQRSRSDARVTTPSGQPGTGPHSQRTMQRSPLQSQRVIKTESQEAQADTRDDAGTHHEEGMAPSPSMANRIVHPTSKHSSPAHRSVTSPMSIAGSSADSEHLETAAFAMTLVPFRSATSSPLSDTADAVPPPQPLVDAFETLFAYPLLFYEDKRLPFLLRNVRSGFRAWCRDLDQRSKSEADTGSVASSHPLLIYEYTSPLGVLHSYEVLHPRPECPVCSTFGVFSSWNDLRRHIRWDHEEIECEFSFKEGGIRLVVRIDEYRQPPLPVGSANSDKSTHADIIDKVPVQSVMPNHGEELAPLEERDRSLLRSLVPDPSGHSSLTSTPPQKVMASKEMDRSPHRGSLEVVPEPAEVDVASPTTMTPPCPSSSRQVLPPASPRSRPPTPPPPSDPHGAAYPIISNPEDPLFYVQPTTYRPTGPHLYDHLSALPLQGFGRQTWFVLDKEEETFELVDVLDEDKVLCALWGRWILLNRPFFIADYLAGVQAFVDEYWLVIHRAAGWGALRAWLMVLVSRRFLKNTELVQVLKKYNALVGKDRWPSNN